MPQPNMTSEIRKELKAVNTQLRIHDRDHKRAYLLIQKTRKALDREETKLNKGYAREAAVLIKRRLILEGRLS